MAVALHVFIREKGAADDAPIGVEHVFYAPDEAAADRLRLAHLAGDEQYARAEVDERAVEMIEEIDDADVPTWADVAEEEEPPLEVHGREVEPEEEA